MHFQDVPYGFPYGRTGIFVQVDELDIFAQFVQYHNINHRYANFASILKRIKNQNTSVTFYFEHGRMRYATPGCVPWTIRSVKMCDLWEDTVDMSDVLELLA